MPAAAVYVPPVACVRALREVATAGAELILFTPFLDQTQQMERIAAEIRPQLSYSADRQKSTASLSEGDGCSR